MPRAGLGQRRRGQLLAQLRAIRRLLTIPARAASSPVAPLDMPSTHDPRAIFVVGSPRSGTSVLAWALAQHEDLATGPEMDVTYFLAKLIGQAEPAPDTPLRKLEAVEHALQVSLRREDGWLAKLDVSRAEVLAAMGQGLNELFSRTLGGKRWIDSTPACAMTCPQLAGLFPEASFLHIVRDGRAAVSSMIHSGFDVRIAKDFDFACETWASFVKHAHAFCEAEPGRALELRQEDMARDPEGVMERVLPFLDCQLDEAVPAFLRKGRINSSWGNEKEGDVARQKDHSVVPKTPWREWSRGRKRSFRKLAGEVQEAMGYPLDLD